MNLYLQVLSQCQSTEVLRLLSVPSGLHANQVECCVKVSAGGRLERRNFDCTEKAVESLRDAKFNQLEVVYPVHKSQEIRIPGAVVSIVGVFTPSPTSDLWFKVADWPVGGEREVRSRKMNAKASETALAYYNVDRKPSVYEVVIEVDTSHSHDEVLDDCAEWLAKYIPQSLRTLGVFGCVDAGGPEFFVKLESNVLMTENIRIMAKLLPPAYPELGQRFEALHPVMFGSKRVCNGIGAVLGKEARIFASTAISDFAVVRLDIGCESEAVRRRVASLLLPSAVQNG
ncbi:MAG: hypothetical protein ACXWIU_09480 [Limisphaerales bacterium]